MKNQTLAQGWRHSRRLAGSVVLAGLVLGGLPIGSKADTHIWDGSSSGYWGTGQNWQSGTVPADGDDLMFPAGAAHFSNTNNLANRHFRSLTFGGSGYSLNGSSITLSNGLSAQYAAGTATVGLGISLGAAQVFACTTAGATLDVTGDIDLGTQTLSVQGAGRVRLQCAVAGSGGLTKNGSGTLVLSGSTANTYTGTTRVNEGTLQLAKTSGNAILHGQLIIGDGVGSDVVQEFADYQIGSVPITIHSSGYLDLDLYDDTLSDITLDGGQINVETGHLTLAGDLSVLDNADRQARISVSGSGGLVLSGTRTFDIANTPFSPDLRLEAPIEGTGGFIKTGAGSLGLYGNNTFEGAVTVNAGYIYMYNRNALGSTSGGTTINGNGVLSLASAVQVGNEPLTLNSFGSGSLGALHSGSDSNSWAGNITLARDGRISVLTNGFLYLSGVIGGSGGLVKESPGTLCISGLAPNTFTGTTYVNAGTLLLDKSGVDGALPGPGALVIGDGLGGPDADRVEHRRTAQIDRDVDIYIEESGFLEMDVFSDEVRSLFLKSAGVHTTTGTLFLYGDVWATSSSNRMAFFNGKLALQDATRTFNITNSYPGVTSALNTSGTISGTGGLRKTGEGRLYLAGSNTYSGQTTVAEGLLVIQSDQALGSTSAGTVVENGAALGIAHAHVGNEALTINGFGPHRGAALQEVSQDYSNSWAGPITLAADTAIWVSGGANDVLNLMGVISGPGGFTKTGDGTLLLSGTAGNTYAGDTLVAGGRLLLGKNAGLGVAIRYGSLTIGDDVDAASTDVVRFLANNQLWSTVPITINRSGWLDLNGYSDTVGSLTFAGGRAGSGTGGLLHLSGDVTANSSADGPAALEGNLEIGAVRTFNIADSPFGPDLRLLAVVSGSGGINKTGAGSLGLYAPNTFAGPVTVNSGVVYVFDSAALGATAGGTVVSAGASLVLAGDNQVGAEPLTLNGSGLGFTGVLDSRSGSNSWAGTVTLATDAVITVQTNCFLNLAAALVGAGGFTKAGPGDLSLSGVPVNTFAGDAVVREGTLLLDKAGVDRALPGPGRLIIGDNVGGDQADVVRALQSTQIATAVPITINDSGLLDLNDHNELVGAITFDGGRLETGSGIATLGEDVAVLSPSSAWGKLAPNSATRHFNVSTGAVFSVQAHVVGSGGIYKSGAGPMVLWASNSFAGLSVVQDGWLVVCSSSGLGASDQGTVVSNGASLYLNYGVTISNESLTLNGEGMSPWGALESGYAGDINTWAGPVILNADSTIQSTENNRLVINGPISGAGGLIKVGAGTLQFVGALPNTYAGVTRVKEGTLTLSQSIHDAAIPGDLVIGDGVGGAEADIVQIAAPHPQISSSGAVAIAGSGLLDLSSFSGPLLPSGVHESIGALVGTGHIELGTKRLGVEENGASTVFAGRITGSSGGLAKLGGGVMTLTGANPYAGVTEIASGTLIVNGPQPNSPVQVDSGATLAGNGTVGPVTCTGGAVSPGASPGLLSGGHLLLDPSSTLRVELNGKVPGSEHDQLCIGGTVNLGGARLTLTASGLLPNEGDEFILIQNDDNEAVVNTFAGLPEGALVTAGPRQFRITYTGGSGNDVALVAINTVALRPALSIAPTATNTVLISWPQSDIPWCLCSTTNLLPESYTWADIPLPYASNATHVYCVEPVSSSNKLYRLRGP